MHEKEIEHDLSVIDEGRKQIAKEYDALNRKLQQERSPEKETPKVRASTLRDIQGFKNNTGISI